MQAGMDEGARMDQGGGRQHAQMLGAAGILHRPEEEALSPQVNQRPISGIVVQSSGCGDVTCDRNSLPCIGT